MFSDSYKKAVVLDNCFVRKDNYLFYDMAFKLELMLVIDVSSIQRIFVRL